MQESTRQQVLDHELSEASKGARADSQATIGEQGGGDPMSVFKNHEDAQSFIRAIRDKSLKGFPHTDITITGKVYAVFDLASSGAYIAHTMASEHGAKEGK